MSDKAFDFTGLTVKKLRDDPELQRHVEKALECDGFELVMPPTALRIGDEFLNDGTTWLRVSHKSHPGFQYTETFFIVRRRSEHSRMLEFFFGFRKDQTGA